MMSYIPEEYGRLNFEISSSGEHYNLTGKYIQELKNRAEESGYQYSWMPLALDYDIPEITDVDYRTQCPIIYGELGKFNANLACTTYYLLPHKKGINGEDIIMPAVIAFTNGSIQIDKEDLINYAKAISYMRFALRDKRRENDHDFWKHLYETHIVSNNAVIVFSEDVERARTWAEETFPKNLEYATQGKVGEFAFQTWAGERRLPLSNIDLVVRDTPDHYDFLYELPFSVDKIRVDVKTYLETSTNKKRKHWHISKSCIHGFYKKDIFTFVVLNESMQYATIVGMLFAKDIERVGEYCHSNYNNSGYYRVYEKDLINPYYVQAFFDTYSRFINGMGFGVSSPKALEETIKDYPLDPVIAYELGYPDPYTPRRGGLHNLCCFATKKSVIPISPYYANDFYENDWMSQY
jgi:hypothetical protein